MSDRRAPDPATARPDRAPRPSTAPAGGAASRVGYRCAACGREQSPGALLVVVDRTGLEPARFVCRAEHSSARCFGVVGPAVRYAIRLLDEDAARTFDRASSEGLPAVRWRRGGRQVKSSARSADEDRDSPPRFRSQALRKTEAGAR